MCAISVRIAVYYGMGFIKSEAQQPSLVAMLLEIANHNQTCPNRSILSRLGEQKKSNRRQINAPPIANSPAASAGNVSLAAYAHTGCSASESQIQSQMVILLEDRTKLLSCRVCVSVGSSTGRCRSPTPLYLPVFAQITCCHSSSSVMQRGGMFASVPFQPSYLSLHAHLPARLFLHPAQRLTMWEDTVLTLS